MVGILALVLHGSMACDGRLGSRMRCLMFELDGVGEVAIALDGAVRLLSEIQVS